MRPGDRAVLQVRGLTKSYGEEPVLEDVSFELRAGEIVLIAGTNGAGKSTLLRCLAGLATFQGEVSLAGVSITRGVSPRGLAYVPQSVELPESATVGEVITFFSRLRGADADALDMPAGFLPPWDRRIATLSGGQRQRVVLAASMQGRPSLLLLDEPAANLDDAGSRDLRGFLRQRAKGGAAVLIASPTPETTLGLFDRILRLEDGYPNVRDHPLPDLAVMKGGRGS